VSDVPEALEDKVANLFTHMGAVLEAAGGTWADVIKVNFYVKDISLRSGLNKAWVEKFPDPTSRPARYTQVSATSGSVMCDFTAYIASAPNVDRDGAVELPLPGLDE
jgi:2-iminobutanoate/2-iminopropanoate deaminase